ncbi:MAG: TonB-dependent receptor [Chitinophagales bacterium]
MKQWITLGFTAFTLFVQAQTGILKGRITEAGNNKPLDFVTVAVSDTQAVQTDEKGEFIFTGLKPGFYNLKMSSVGYKLKSVFEIEVTNAKPATINVELERSEQNLKEVEVKAKANPFMRKEESPISVRSIGVNEIQRYPGGNRDISRVVQSLPGVGFSTGFRNDLIIRGGSTAENRFYLDDIEIPNINHFATQGGSGGPVGLINVDFIREVNFYSSAFPANRGNMLSSNMDVRLRDGRDDRFGATLTLGITESALSFESPLNKKKNATILGSVRGSYYNWFFKIIQVPIFPNYNDAQVKVKWKISKKDDLTFLTLAACDLFRLNLNANKTESQRYTLSVVPINNQWNYTVGLKYNHYFNNSSLQVVVSRNELINQIYKNKDNNKDSIKTSDYFSREAENKLRVEYTIRNKGWKYNIGASYELAQYLNRSNFTGPYFKVNYETKLLLHSYGLFGQVSKTFFKERLALSLGWRMDGNSYNSSMANLARQFSPRFSASVSITEKVRWNFNTGYYHQRPAYTVLGYRDGAGTLINQPGLTYIRNVHVVTGFEYATKVNSRVSVEGFYKQYFNVPFQTDDSVSLFNKGSDFGVVGNSPVVSTNKGRSYGLELLYEQKLFKGWFGIASYTLFWSQFQDKNGKYTSSSWDTRHIISLTAGKKFKRNWEVGGRFRVQGGSPYTPINTAYSSLIPVYNSNPQGVIDYSNQLNAKRLPWFHQLDIRVTKKWYLKYISIETFLDIQNLYFNKVQQPPYFVLDRDAAGNPQTVPGDPSRYQTKLLENKSGTVLPTLGLIISY